MQRFDGALQALVRDLAATPLTLVEEVADNRHRSLPPLPLGGERVLLVSTGTDTVARLGAGWLDRHARLPATLSRPELILQRPTHLQDVGLVVALTEGSRTATPAALLAELHLDPLPLLTIGVNARHQPGLGWSVPASEAPDGIVSLVCQMGLMAMLALDCAVARRRLTSIDALALAAGLTGIGPWLAAIDPQQSTLDTAASLLAGAPAAIIAGGDPEEALITEAAIRLARLAGVPTMPVGCRHPVAGFETLVGPTQPLVLIARAGADLAGHVAMAEAARHSGAAVVVIGDSTACEAVASSATVTLALPPAGPLNAWAAVPIGLVILLQRLALATRVRRRVPPQARARPRPGAKS
ncbi:MAG: hypothetical protein EAZ99_08535 [Alphaproteobacteria bacterium]|nr:MAG: hypothetical protein EAZ99_08535 [Alphaproteobacteria bacterium]